MNCLIYKALFNNGYKINYTLQLILRKLLLEGIISSLIVVFIVIFIVVVMGVKLEVIGLLIIGYLIGKSDTIWRHFFSKNKEESQKVISTPLEKPEFRAEIINNSNFYTRGQDTVIFRSRYKGRLKNGYFVNKIIPTKNKFLLSTPYANSDGSIVMSYCLETINNPKLKTGKINGNWDVDWKEWGWKITEDAPLGKYTVKMMILNENSDESLLQPIVDTFEVIDPINPVKPYNPYNKPNFK